MLIPCGGRHSRLALRAAASCLAADPPPDQVILIDDHSSPPPLWRLIKTARMDPEPIVITLPEHVGRSAARNLGALRATGDWLFFLDADDRMLKHAVGDFRRKLSRDPGIDLLFADYLYEHPKTGQHLPVRKRPWTRDRRIYNAVNIGMFCRRSRFEEVGGFDEDMAMLEYWDFFLRYTGPAEIRVEKHDRPFFVAGSGTSVVANSEQLIARANEKIRAMMLGGYYRQWGHDPPKNPIYRGAVKVITARTVRGRDGSSISGGSPQRLQ